MHCVCGENIHLVKTQYGWIWIHNASETTLCPDGRGSIRPLRDPRTTTDPDTLQLEKEISRLRHTVRVAADFRDQIHPDVDWDRVPPWTMNVVRILDRLLAAFDEEDN